MLKTPVAISVTFQLISPGAPPRSSPCVERRTRNTAAAAAINTTAVITLSQVRRMRLPLGIERRTRARGKPGAKKNPLTAAN